MCVRLDQTHVFEWYMARLFYANVIVRFMNIL